MRGWLGTFLFAIVAGLVLPGIAQAMSIRGQDGCRENAGRPCLQFDHDDPIPVIRTFEIAAGRPGVYELHFNGSLECKNTSASRAVVDLVSQINTDGEGTPSAAGQSGLRHAVVFDSRVPGKPPPRESFSLFSIRTLATAIPNQIVSFRLQRSRMDPGTRCRLFNNSFSSIFVRTGEASTMAGGTVCSNTGSGICTTFSREFVVSNAGVVFDAPAAGKALVSMHGALSCGGQPNVKEPLDLESQVVRGDAEPRSKGLGGLRNAIVIQPGLPEHTESLSLASSRLFQVKQGEHAFNFAIRQRRMGAASRCHLFNRAVSVLYSPSTTKVDMRSQEACDAAGGFCRRVDGNRRLIARSFQLKAASAGTARLEFRGSLTCTNDKDAAYDVTVKGQIVPHKVPIAAPNPNGPGGLLQTQRMKSAPDIDSADTVNLSASRVVKFAKAGGRTFDFVLDVRSGRGLQRCRLHNASFASVFAPR